MRLRTHFFGQLFWLFQDLGIDFLPYYLTAFVFDNIYLCQTLTEYVHTFWCIDMPDVTASYGTSFDFVEFFKNIHT